MQRHEHRTPSSAWRNLIARLRSGFLYLREAAAKVRGVRFCDEHSAQTMTLRPVGLPHHRHPLTVDEALAGIILSAVSLSSVIYLLVRWL